MALVSGTLAADGNTTAITLDGSVGTLIIKGTWGSGTLQGYVSPDGGSNYFTVTGATLAADGSFNFSLPQGWIFRATLSGASGPDLDYYIHS